MYSSQLSWYQLLFLCRSYFIHLSIAFHPQRLFDRIVWGIRSQFFPIGFLGFRIRRRTAQVQPEWLYLGIFVYHSLVMMLNVVCYLDGIKHSGSTVRAAYPFPSLSREYKQELSNFAHFSLCNECVSDVYDLNILFFSLQLRNGQSCQVHLLKS